MLPLCQTRPAVLALQVIPLISGHKCGISTRLVVGYLDAAIGRMGFGHDVMARAYCQLDQAALPVVCVKLSGRVRD